MRRLKANICKWHILKYKLFQWLVRYKMSVAHDNCKQVAIRVWKKLFTHFVNVRDSYNLIVSTFFYYITMRWEMSRKETSSNALVQWKMPISAFSCEYQFYELRDAIKSIIFYVATVKSSNFYFCGI